jgi:hypothetical protein
MALRATIDTAAPTAGRLLRLLVSDPLDCPSESTHADQADQ